MHGTEFSCHKDKAGAPTSSENANIDFFFRYCII